MNTKQMIANLKEKMMSKNKKGVLGLETVVTFMIMILILAIFTIAIFITLTSINTGVPQLTPTESGTLTNETLTMKNESGNVTSVSTRRDIAFSNVVIINASAPGTVLVLDDNYTVVGGVINATDADIFIDTQVNFSASFTFRPTSNSENLENNVTGGLVTFFAGIATVFSILLAVVIILAVVLIIIAVTRIRAGAGPSIGDTS